MRSLLQEGLGKASEVRGRREGAWGEMQVCSEGGRPEGDLGEGGGARGEEGWQGGGREGGWRGRAREGESELVHWEVVGLVEVQGADQTRLRLTVVALDL